MVLNERHQISNFAQLSNQNHNTVCEGLDEDLGVFTRDFMARKARRKRDHCGNVGRDSS